MQRWASKVVSVAVSFCLPLFFTVLPHFISGRISKYGRRGERVLSYLLCFGGGIFLGTYLLHMAPEVRDLLDNFLLTPNGITYPVADLIVGIGFFFVLFMEKVITRINKRRSQKKGSKEADGSVLQQKNESKEADDKDDCCTSRQSLSTNGNESSDASIKKEQSFAGDRYTYISQFVYENEVDLSDSSVHRADNDQKKPPSDGFSNPPESTTKNTKNGRNGTPQYASSGHQMLESGGGTGGSGGGGTGSSGGGGGIGGGEMTAGEKSRESVIKLPESPEIIHACHCDDETGHASHSHVIDGGHGVRSFILMLALSLHHIFEGMSIGLQLSVQKVFTLLGAVMSHETIISFSLGMQLIRCRYSFLRLLITAIACSLFEPVGVAIGTAMMETTEAVNDDPGSPYYRIQLANGILQAFAAGTFIFVTFFEILQDEIQSHDSSIGKVLCAFLGFSALALMQLIPEEEKSDPGTTKAMMENFTTTGTTEAMMENFTTTMASFVTSS